MVMNSRDICPVFSCVIFLPENIRYKTLAPKHFIHQHLEIVGLVIVNGDPDTAIFSQQLPQQDQTRIHHRQPLTMLQPVVIVFERTLRVVWWVDEDALYLTGVERNQRFQRQQIVTLDDEIFGSNSVAVTRFAF